jgi:hypothetical protein
MVKHMQSPVTSGCHKGDPSWLAKISNHAKIGEQNINFNLYQKF